MNEEERLEFPEPHFGTAPDPSMEHTKYLSENESFEKDEDGNIMGGDLPEHIKTRFWAFLVKDSVLTWMEDQKDIRIVMDKLDTAIIAYYMRLKPGEFTFEDLQHLENLRTIVFFKAKRSYKGFERTQQSTQISQQLYGQIDNEIKRKPGMIRRFAGGMFGGNE